MASIFSDVPRTDEDNLHITPNSSAIKGYERDSLALYSQSEIKTHRPTLNKYKTLETPFKSSVNLP